MRAVWLIPSLYFAMICTLALSRERLQLWRILRFRRAHNLLMSVYSALVLLYMGDKLSHSRADLLCTARAGAAPFWFASKFVEWMDTVMLLARFKTVETLHLFHHATAPVVTFLNERAPSAPTPLYDIGTLLNAFVHTVMYLYYADPRLFRPIRKWITAMQIFQHAVVVLLVCVALATEGCDAPRDAYGTSLIAYTFYLCLFVRFYVTTY